MSDTKMLEQLRQANSFLAAKNDALRASLNDTTTGLIDFRTQTLMLDRLVKQNEEKMLQNEEKLKLALETVESQRVKLEQFDAGVNETLDKKQFEIAKLNEAVEHYKNELVRLNNVVNAMDKKFANSANQHNLAPKVHSV